MKKLNKWTLSNDSDFDRTIETRTIYGKMTKKRYKRMMRGIRAYNYAGEAPHGRSESGYRYSCGHDYDCCGCVSSYGISLEIVKAYGHTYRLTFTKYVSFNY